MTARTIDETRADLAHADRGGVPWPQAAHRLLADVPSLLAEVERLRTEVEEWRVKYHERTQVAVSLIADLVAVRGVVQAVEPTLREHYLYMIECYHEGERNKPYCGCSLVDLGWHPNTPAARDAWIEHFRAALAAAVPGAAEDETLTFAELSAVSQSRRDRWHTPDTEPWTGADWSNAMCGEAGEAANVVKKLRRHETGMADKIPVDELVRMLADELGDVVAYCDLLGRHYGIDLGAAVARKFNFISEREGFPERLPVGRCSSCHGTGMVYQRVRGGRIGVRCPAGCSVDVDAGLPS